MNSDPFVSRNLLTWIVIFALASLFESAIRIFTFHDAWAASVAFEFLALNLGVALLFAIAAGLVHSLLVFLAQRGGERVNKLTILLLPSAGFVWATWLAIVIWMNYQQIIPAMAPYLQQACFIGLLILTYAVCMILVRKLSTGTKRILLFLLILSPAVILILNFVRGARFAKDSIGPVRYVVLISIDTLRHDYVGAYGASVATPHMDKVAKEGALFKVAVAPVPQTGPSHTTMFTGQTPLGHGIHVNGQRLPANAWTITKRLRNAGFQTAGFISGYPLRAKNCGLQQGFQIYDDHLAFIDRLNETSLGRLLERTQFFRRGILLVSPDVTDRALAWLEKNSESPFFLFLHYYDPHYPYNYAQKQRKHPQWIISKPKHLPRQKQFYRQTVEKVDSQIGRVIETLKQKGIYDQTLLIITADHGESLGEHDYYYDHSRRLYEQLIRVPMIIRCPSMIQAGSRIEKQVSLMDIPRTILASLGIGPDETLKGYNLIQLTKNIPDDYNRVTLSHAFEEKLDAIRTENWKLIRNRKGNRESFEFYELISDPSEAVNLFQTEKEKAGALHQMMINLVDRDEKTEVPANLTPEQVERLRSLGYVQ